MSRHAAVQQRGTALASLVVPQRGGGLSAAAMPTASLLLRSYAAAATSSTSPSSSGTSGTASAAADEGRAVAHARRREGGPLRVLISGATVGGLTLGTLVVLYLV